MTNAPVPVIIKQLEIQAPNAPNARSIRRLGALELTLPPGWDTDSESNQALGLYKSEVKNAGNANEYLKIYIRDVTRLWRHRPSASWQEYTRTLVDEVIRKSSVLEDGGYVQGKTSRGIDILTRRALYKYSSARNMHWDHVGVHGANSLYLAYIQYPSKEFYQKHEPEIQQLLNSVRFVP